MLPDSHRLMFIPANHPIKCAPCHADMRPDNKVLLDKGYLKEIFDRCGE